ncbi:MAG: HAD-IIIC family phosphatase [Oligoflexia bacterium]|nr:HAD-IIIC family phosphatase [Oligoflexia bacterium]
MEILDYPFDSAQLIRKKKSILKELHNYDTQLEKKIAFLGSSSTQEIAEFTKIFAKKNKIKLHSYESLYGRYYEDALFSNEELNKFHPDIAYIHTGWRDANLPDRYNFSNEEINTRAEETINRFEKMWSALKERFNCEIIQNNFEQPPFRPLGNLEFVHHCGVVNYINKLNLLLSERLKNFTWIKINDIHYLSAKIGLDNWHDINTWAQYKYALKYEAIPSLSFQISNIINGVVGKSKKVCVLDLDNTLWGGVIGDDHIDQIKLGPNFPVGEIYSEFQEYVTRLKSRGVLLAIASKNQEENALKGLAHPHSRLKPSDFSVIEAHWEPKSTSLKNIASTLDLNVDSMVFIDDNPAEREIIKQQCPSSTVLNIDSNAEGYLKMLDQSGFFETTHLTNEDLKRSELYAQRKEILREANNWDNYSDYLKSLQMKLLISPINHGNLERVVQLINKTNQFNLRTKRYTETDVMKMLSSSNYQTYTAILQDKFSDHGLISIIILKIEKEIAFIDTFLMSCRVLKRGVEIALMKQVIDFCEGRGVSTIVGEYIPTEKNQMVKNLYEELMFSMFQPHTPDQSIGIGTGVDSKSVHWKLEIGQSQFPSQSQNNKYQHFLEIVFL